MPPRFRSDALHDSYNERAQADPTPLLGRLLFALRVPLRQCRFLVRAWTAKVCIRPGFAKPQPAASFAIFELDYDFTTSIQHLLPFRRRRKFTPPAHSFVL
jgi:hypothetical protein